MCVRGVISREDAAVLSDAELEAVITVTVASMERLRACLHVATAEHGERRLFQGHGQVNEAEFLRSLGVGRKDAGRVAAQGRVLARHPFLQAAHASGRIGGDRLDLLLRVAKGATADVFTQDEEVLVDKVVAASSLRDAERVLMAWLDTVTADGTPPPDHGDDDRVDMSKVFDALLGQFRLTGENAEVFAEELDRRMDQVARADKIAGIQRTVAQRRAAALVLMAQASAADRPATRPLVVMVMTHEEWMSHQGGSFVRTGFAASPETVERNLCTSRLCRFVIDAKNRVMVRALRDAGR
jgi:hypothetical protein